MSYLSAKAYSLASESSRSWCHLRPGYSELQRPICSVWPSMVYAVPPVLSVREYRNFIIFPMSSGLSSERSASPLSASLKPLLNIRSNTGEWAANRIRWISQLRPRHRMVKSQYRLSSQKLEYLLKNTPASSSFILAPALGEKVGIREP